jgi:uncharacterized protein (TIGR02145 family)
MGKILMRKIIYILFLVFGYTAYSQSLSVFNVDAGSFPTMRANFFVFDAVGTQLTNFSKSDFEVTENGLPRTVTNVSCPSPNPPTPISSVLVMDISSSMNATGLDIAKSAAKAWVNMLPTALSECALTSFSDANYLNQDFTTNKTKLMLGINNLSCLQGTNYNAALIDSMAGGLIVAKRGKNKRVVVFLSDGEPNTDTKTAEIISEAKANNITIYCVTINMPAPQCMKDFSSFTGGLYFENIRTKEQAEECYRKILMIAQGGNPCKIEWEGGVICEMGLINLEIKLKSYKISSTNNYSSQSNTLTKLEFAPIFLKFSNPTPGMKADQTITVTARNANFNVKKITSSNPSFSVSPKNFTLNSGQSMVLTITYFAVDSGYTFSKLIFENEFCPTTYYVAGGFPGKPPSQQILNLISPNGDEIFPVGSDTVITWGGVAPDYNVRIEYSIDNGTVWLPIADSSKGLVHKWLVPNTPSKKCLARVSIEGNFVMECPEVPICSQIWMGCNLNVERYRNGDLIPEVQDPNKWFSLTSGAWCYYNNDPLMGAIYGKFYNWYAVHDSRGLAPKGWHIPSDAEWTELSDCLGGLDVAGGKLKTDGTIEDGDGLWYSPNTGANNETGFTALPSAYRNEKGTFGGLGFDCSWWTSSHLDTYDAWLRYIGYDKTNLFRNTSSKRTGYSVRCIKD